MLKAIFFDLDGTLCDTATSMSSALGETFEYAKTSHDLFPTLGDWLRVHEQVSQALRKKARPYPSQAKTVRVARFSAVLQAFHIEDLRLAEQLADLYGRKLMETLTLFPEAKQVLERLHGRYVLGLVTDAPTDLQREKIRRLGIEQYFAHIIIGPEVGLWKPRTEIFQLALDRSRVAASEAAYVGDSIRDDIGGAKAAGMMTVWVNRKGEVRLPSDPSPNYVIGNLNELLDLVP